MENFEVQTQPGELQAPQLIVTENMRSYLYDMAKWANFLAIVGFVMTGFMILGAFSIGSALNTNPELAERLMAAGISPMIFTILLLLYAFAVFYPSLLMFKYSVRAKLGILYAEQASLEDAIARLKSLFKYWGILTLVFIGLYMIMIVFSAFSRVA